jgi:hypothetical protein
VFNSKQVSGSVCACFLSKVHGITRTLRCRNLLGALLPTPCMCLNLSFTQGQQLLNRYHRTTIEAYYIVDCV